MLCLGVHGAPEKSRSWRIQVLRDPLRYRARRCGRTVLRSPCRDVTGRWLDDLQPLSISGSPSRDRLHIVLESRRPISRCGAPRRTDPEAEAVASLAMPLAADGGTADKIMGISGAFDAKVRLI